jgi:hypothetical protein
VNAAERRLNVGRRIFVSYSRRDFYFAEQLAVALRRRELAAWFDVHELAAGTDWSAGIDRAIVECDALVLVATRASLESPYVRRERDRAAELGRPQVAVTPTRRRLPEAPTLPTYDLTSSFGRGVDVLVRDLASGRATGRRRRIGLPYSAGACLVALAPALSLLFAAVLCVSFLRAVVGHQAEFVDKTDVAIGVACSMIALVGVWSAYTLWAFLRRRITWIYLRGGLFSILLTTPVAVVTVDSLAGYVTTSPLEALFGSSDESTMDATPYLLAAAVMAVSLAALIATELSAGLCRHLRTGTAPMRVRRRHIGAIPEPSDRRPLRSYRLFASDDDASVRDEIRSALAEAGIHETANAGGGDRDIFVVSDRTPTEWLSRNDLREPIAVAATSIALPVRGVLQRYQWVDYRARQRKVLRTLAADLVGKPVGDASPVRDVPESLQRNRLPRWVMVVEWTLYCLGVLAAEAAAYVLALRASEGRSDLLWPTVLGLAFAPVPFLVARWLRRRRLTPGALVAAVVLCWAVLIALGFDRVQQDMSPAYDRGSFSAATPVYPALQLATIALAWRSLRRWLPRGMRARPAAKHTLGAAGGSLAWLAMLIPAVLGTAGSVVLLSSTSSDVPPITLPTVVPDDQLASADVCLDQAGIEALGKPYGDATDAIRNSTADTIDAALKQQTRAVRGVVPRLEQFEARTSWGENVSARLAASLERSDRADRALRNHRISVRKWRREHRAFRQAVDDLTAPVC